MSQVRRSAQAPLYEVTGQFVVGGVILWAMIVFMGGCAINPRIELRDLAPHDLVRQRVEAPFYPQTAYQCGPAALAGILGASGIETSPEQLSSQVFLPEREGSLQMELLAAARRAGRVAYVLKPEPRALIAEIRSGRPVLVLENLGTRSTPVWHYAVLTGYDSMENEMVLNSGAEEGQRMPVGKFFRIWDWGGRWAMVTLRPGELPGYPDAQKFAEAVDAFERVAGGRVAVPSWLAAIERWPEDYRPHLALGNIAYLEGQMSLALEHYQRGLRFSPDQPVLLNNLAIVLAKTGCPRTAESQLENTYVHLDSQSPWHDEIESTLQTLRKSDQADLAHCAKSLRPE